MKKKNIILISTFSSLGATAILIPSIVVPLTINKKEMSIDEKLIESYKNILNDDAEEKIYNLFFSNSNVRINQNITKEKIKESIHFDKTTYLYQEINKLNPNLSNADDELASEIYQMYQEEINQQEQNTTARCGSVFKKHFWYAVCMKARALLLNSLSVLWWAVQLAPAIVSFVQTLDGAALTDAFAGFDFKLPPFFEKCLVSTVKTIKEFKTKTKCSWKFKIWTQGIFI